LVISCYFLAEVLADVTKAAESGRFRKTFRMPMAKSPKFPVFSLMAEEYEESGSLMTRHTCINLSFHAIIFS
jgi:hypothetical protein